MGRRSVTIDNRWQRPRYFGALPTFNFDHTVFHSCAACSSWRSHRSYSVAVGKALLKGRIWSMFCLWHDTADWQAEELGESILQRRPKKNCGTRPQERPSRWFGSLNLETIASDLANLEPDFSQTTLRIKHSQSPHIRNFL